MTVRVMHLTYDMRIGGTEMVIKNLIEGNDDPTIEMSIFCLEAPLGPWGEELQAAGIPISTQARQPGFDTRLIGAIRTHIKEHNIDVLHCHQYTPWVYGALAAAFTKTKVIFTEHGRFYPDSSSWKRRWVNPILLKLTDHVTAISKATKQALVDYEFIPAERIEVIYNGIKSLKVDNDEVEHLRTSFGWTKEHKVLGTVARLDPIKNQRMMLRVFANVHRKMPNARLLIVGDGEERERLKQLAESLEILPHVVFTGYISQPVNHLALMDLFLLPSFSEGTSMTLLEAMSLSIPCIVSDVGGNPEVVIEKQTGRVLESDNENAHTSAIVTLLADDNTINEYASQSRLFYEQLFTAACMCNHYNSLYRKAS